jgi:hypothetical protein
VVRAVDCVGSIGHSLAMLCTLASCHCLLTSVSRVPDLTTSALRTTLCLCARRFQTSPTGHGRQTQLPELHALLAPLIQSCACARSKVPMGSHHHYTSASQFVFAAVDSNPNPRPSHSHKPKTTVQIPITSLPERARAGPPDAAAVAAAAKIQAALRGYLVRRHAAAVRGADAEATRLERLLRRQETVDAVRGDERERARFSEALMAVLLRLDAVPGRYPAVRDARRAVSRRVVGLQEVFDAVVAAPAAQTCGVPASLEQVLEGIWGVGEAPVPVPPAPAMAAVEEEVRRGGSCWARFFGV